MTTDLKIKVNNRSFRPRLPFYLKQTIPIGQDFQDVTGSIQDLKLNTVCEEAKCPNRTHCYAVGTLTFQILGAVCTRSCGFCAEQFGKPTAAPDPSEPNRVLEAALRLKLNHVVITSPARDDLADQGAGQFGAVVSLFKKKAPNVTVEILTPDFQDQDELLNLVFSSQPDVFNHNIETVRRLTPKVRSKATYDRTLSVLRKAAQAGLVAKSGFMVGHGESRQEISETLRDLRKAGVRLATVGQYLPPSPNHLPVDRFYEIQEFNEIRDEGLALGFDDVASGPLVRSSFHAEEGFRKINTSLSSR